jgi:hypothetical protein
VKPGWVIGFLTAWLILSIICSVCEMQANPMGTSEGQQVPTIFMVLMQPDLLNFSNPVTGVVSLFSAAGTIITALWNSFWFNYSFLIDSTLGQYFRYLCLCISAGFIVTVILNLIRAFTPSGAGV